MGGVILLVIFGLVCPIAITDAVNVVINSSNVPLEWCTDINHLVCQNLSYALKEWAVYNILVPPEELVVFQLYDNVTTLDSTLFKHFSKHIIPASNFIIKGMLGKEKALIRCLGNMTLIFEGYKFVRTSFIMESVTLEGCGFGLNRGLLLYGFIKVGIGNSTFTRMTGVQLINIEEVSITSCVFKENIITPSAALSIQYDNITEFRSDQILVNINDTNFINNSENVDIPSLLPGEAGLLVVSLTKLQTNSHNFAIKISNCTFANNIIKRQISQSFFLFISKVTVRQYLKFVMKKCTFLNNTLSFSFKTSTSPTDTKVDTNIQLFNTNFTTNIQPSGRHAILHITSSTTDSFTYDNLLFNNNIGACFIINPINGYTNHYLLNGIFNNNNGQSFAIISAFSDGTMTNNAYNHHLLMKNITAQDNTGESGVVHLKFFYLDCSNLNFLKNGYSIKEAYYKNYTAFSIESVQIILSGNNSFLWNRGILGGAIAIREVLDYPMTFNTTPSSNTTFDRNYADYGGAIYVDANHFINSTINLSSGLCNGKFIFTHNHAKVSGQNAYMTSVYINSGLYICNAYFDLGGMFATKPTILTINQDPIELYPGQNIELNDVTLRDLLGNSASCQAEAFLYCGTELCEQTNKGIQLAGPPQIFLSGINQNIRTQLQVINSRNSDKQKPINTTLIFTCVRPNMQNPIRINATVLPNCSLGFTYNETEGKCLCDSIDKKYSSQHFHCSSEDAVACIKRGQWIGQYFSGTIILPCPFPLCQVTGKPCPISLDTDMIRIPTKSYRQCASNRGGLCCSKCRPHYYFTFEGVKCTNHCHKVYPVITIVMAFCFQFVVFLFILATLKLQTKLGSGIFYGPLFFLAILSKLNFFQNKALQIAVRTFTSIFLLDLKLFGEIPWCFWDMPPLAIHSFYYLGPFIVWTLLLFLIFFGKYHPHLLSKVQKSPIQAICLLIMQSFWSVANTSMHILMPQSINGTLHVKLEPELKYFTSYHIPFSILAILLIIFVLVPFFVILLASNIRRTYQLLSLHRLKPLFDEFQSCYKDNHRWFCVIYYSSWIIFLLFSEFHLGRQLLLILLLSLHFIFQPYKKHILNIIDMFLLLDLIFVVSILDCTVVQLNTIKTSTVYICVMLPLFMYVVCGCGAIIEKQFYKYKEKHTRITTLQTNATKCLTNNEDMDQEREPLIRVIQEYYN